MSSPKTVSEAPESVPDGQEQLQAPEPPKTVDGTAEALPDDPEDFKPSGADLEVAVPEEVFAVLDRHDESQILDELQSRLLDVTLYDFPQDGGRVTDLSYAGVREVTGLMNRTGKVKLRLIPGSLRTEDRVENGEPHIRAEVWAEDLVTGAAFPGIAYEPKLMKLKDATAKKWRAKGKQVPDDNKVWDSFAETKAAAKAERNALKKFIPEQIRQTLIAQYQGDPVRIKQIQAGAGAEKLAEMPAPVQSDEANKLRALIRATYDELKQHNRLAMPPGQFNALMVRHDYSEERLQEFLAHLEGLVEKEKERLFLYRSALRASVMRDPKEW